VQAGEVEIEASLLPVPKGLSSYRVRDEPMMAVLPKGHRLAERGRLRMAELAETPCILFGQGFALNGIIRSAYAKRGVPWWRRRGARSPIS